MAHRAPPTRYDRRELGTRLLTLTTTADVTPIQGHVRVGQRRVQVRQSQLDAFLAAGESGPRAAGPNFWQEVSEAASTVVDAVRAQDRDALDRAISRLTDAAQEIPSGAESAPI